MQPATRFLQRLDSYERALTKLNELVELFNSRPEYVIFQPAETGLNIEIAREALIKRFEYTQELSWNLLKDYLLYQGETDVSGSRDVYRRALRLHLIDNPSWMDMILDRNVSAHDYNDAKVAEIAGRIIDAYHPLMKLLLEDMRRRAAAIPVSDR